MWVWEGLWGQSCLRSLYHKAFAVKNALSYILLSLITGTVLLFFSVALNLRVPIQCSLMNHCTKSKLCDQQSTDYLVFTKNSKLVREPRFSQCCSSENMHANLAVWWRLGVQGRNQLSTDFKVTGSWLMNCYCRFGVVSRKLQFDMLINQTDKLASQA